MVFAAHRHTMTTPRILMISDEGPQTGTAGGLLLHRLLAGHPADRLRIIARYVPTLGEPLPGVVYRQISPPWLRFEKSRFNRLKRSLRAFGCVPPVPLRRLDALADGFKPDVVLCVMQHAVFYDTAARYARARKLPLVVIVHDVNDDFEPVLPWARFAARSRDSAFYRQAARRLCVSPEMESYFKNNYNAPGDVLYPNRSPDLSPIPPERVRDLRTSGRLTVGFAGNLGYGYGRELVRLIPALRASGSRLIVYARPPGPDCSELYTASDCVELRGFKPAAEAWEGIQRDCDAVWLAYPVPAGEFERLYRCHFPSKLPEYLALGLPVIVSGPAFATGVRWALNNPGAVIGLTDPSVADMARVFTDLAGSAGTREELARQGIAAGNRDFDPTLIIRTFQQAMASAASGSS
jgi:glycosyltransferase involved in cell wall biosynthesis